MLFDYMREPRPQPEPRQEGEDYRPAVGDNFTVSRWISAYDNSYRGDLLTATFVDEHMVIAERASEWKHDRNVLDLNFDDVALRPLSNEAVAAIRDMHERNQSRIDAIYGKRPAISDDEVDLPEFPAGGMPASA